MRKITIVEFVDCRVRQLLTQTKPPELFNLGGQILQNRFTYFSSKNFFTLVECPGVNATAEE